MRPASTPSSLRAVLAFTSASNVATGVATTGIFFLTESAYAFSTAENYLLGLLLGVSYALAAWKAGPLVRALARPGGTSCRSVLAAMAVGMAAICTLPWLWRERWAVYVFIALYTPITGVFWPLVESFLSGGRRGADLRRALGSFNVVWSGSMALALLLVTPLVPEHPLAILLALAFVHLASLACLPAFGRDPARHVEEAHAAPASYRALLSGHQVLLVASYLVMFALTPYLPELLEKVAVSPGWRVALGTLWMPVRVAVFFVLGRWHRWHGRRWLAWGGALLLIGGFGSTVLAPYLGSHLAVIAALVGGQIAFGIAIAALYAANLYYTLEVGDAAVDAGGSHEGLIGLGYTLGPLCGAAVAGLATIGVLPEERADELVLVTVELLLLCAATWAWRAIRRPCDDAGNVNEDREPRTAIAE